MATSPITPHSAPETPESGAFVETALSVVDIEFANAAERAMGMDERGCQFLDVEQGKLAPPV